MKTVKHYIKYGLFVVVWLGIIWFLSDQPSLNVGLPDFFDVVVMKMGHVTVYAILGLLLTKLFIGLEHRLVQREFRWWNVLFIFVLGVVLATTDEWHQTMVPGRNGNIVDVFIDSLGLLVGIVWGYRHIPQKLRYSWKTFLTK